MKQTSVEWLQKQLECFGNKHELQMSWATVDELLEQAKAIEEKNLKDSFVAGAGMGEMFNNENRCYVSDAEKYLKETFKSE